MTAPPQPPPADPAAGGSYQVVARRFRPRTFQELVGQEEVIKSLRSALDSGKVPHAFLFSGSRGVGKTTIARILARALNCEKGVSSTPCGTCERCVAILAESDPDVIEIDAASRNSVEDIRDLREKAGYAPMRGRRKVFILDEVHMLSRAAFNAFLKILEEPPAHVTFVLATTEIHKVPETIRSRCQVHLFRRAGETGIEARLQQICQSEAVAVDPHILADIARSCRGGLRDAESALERILPLLREHGTGFTLADYRRNAGRMGLDLVAAVLGRILAGDGSAALKLAADAAATGVDERECLGEVLEILRNVLYLKVDGADSLLVAFAGELRATLQAIAAAQPVARIEAAIQLAVLGRDRIRRLDDRQLLLELTLLRMARLSELTDLRELLDRLDGGAAPAGGRPGGASATLASGSASPASAPLGPAPARAAMPPAAAAASGSGPAPRGGLPLPPTLGGPAATPAPRATPATAPAPAASAAATPVAATPAAGPVRAATAPPVSAVAAPVAGPPPEGWAERFVAGVQSAQPLVADVVARAGLELMDGGATLRLRVPAVPRMVRDRLEASQDALAGVAGQCLGRPTRIALQFGEGGTGPVIPRPPGLQEPAAPGPVAGASTTAPGPAANPEAGPDAQRVPASPAPSAAPPPGGSPGPLAEKVRKRFDGRFV